MYWTPKAYAWLGGTVVVFLIAIVTLMGSWRDFNYNRAAEDPFLSYFNGDQYYGGALGQATKLLKEEPNNPQLLLLSATLMTAVDPQHYSEAEKTYQKLLDLKKEELAARTGLAVLRMKQAELAEEEGKRNELLDEAIRLCDQAAEADRAYAEAYIYGATARLLRGKTSEAIETFDEIDALGQGGGSEGVTVPTIGALKSLYVNKCIAYHETGKHAEAFELAKKAVCLDPMKEALGQLMIAMTEQYLDPWPCLEASEEERAAAEDQLRERTETVRDMLRHNFYVNDRDTFNRWGLAGEKREHEWRERRIETALAQALYAIGEKELIIEACQSLRKIIKRNYREMDPELALRGINVLLESIQLLNPEENERPRDRSAEVVTRALSHLLKENKLDVTEEEERILRWNLAVAYSIEGAYTDADKVFEELEESAERPEPDLILQRAINLDRARRDRQAIAAYGRAQAAGHPDVMKIDDRIRQLEND